MPLTTMQVIPISSVGHVLRMAFLMFWEILWALNLGFLLSAIVQAVVSKAEMSRLLPDDSVKTIAKACVFGAASSSCSYAAVALARSIFRKGASFTAAMVFEIASTNLVAELAIIMVILLGWQFAVAEFLGAPVMVMILVGLVQAVAYTRPGGAVTLTTKTNGFVTGRSLRVVTLSDTNFRPTSSASVSPNRAGASPTGVPAYQFVHSSAPGRRTPSRRQASYPTAVKSTVEAGTFDFRFCRPLEAALVVVAFEFELFDEH